MRDTRWRRGASWACVIVPPLSALAMALGGCAAGDRSADAESEKWNDFAAARAAQMKYGDDPEAGVVLDTGEPSAEARRVRIEAIRSHGGMDAWQRLCGIGYRRARVSRCPTGEDGPSRPERKFWLPVDAAFLSCPCSPEPHGPHFDGPVLRVEDPPVLFANPCSSGADGAPSAEESRVAVAPSRREIAEEYFLACLPFSLEDRALSARYLGVEEDASTGLVYERVRYSWKEPGREEWFIAWLDRSSGLLRKALLRNAGGDLALVVLSEWKEAGGVQVPTRREVFLLDALYDRPGEGSSRTIDTVTELETGR